MQIKLVHPNAIMPTKGTEGAGAFDIYMPEAGKMSSYPSKHRLGFCSAIPDGHIALLLPRSSAGAKFGVELNNTVGVIDSDYRGEWMAILRTKGEEDDFSWKAGERILQFLVVPTSNVTLQLVEELGSTNRGLEGFGTTGK